MSVRLSNYLVGDLLNFPSDEKGKTMSEKVKTVKGPKAAVATFIRPRDNMRIYVFTRKGESVESAITRVKRANGASESEHSLIQN